MTFPHTFGAKMKNPSDLNQSGNPVRFLIVMLVVATAILATWFILSQIEGLPEVAGISLKWIILGMDMIVLPIVAIIVFKRLEKNSSK